MFRSVTQQARPERNEKRVSKFHVMEFRSFLSFGRWLFVFSRVSTLRMHSRTIFKEICKVSLHYSKVFHSKFQKFQVVFLHSAHFPQILDQKIEIKAAPKVGSLDNVTHKPGGGEKKIFDDKDYLRNIEHPVPITPPNQVN